MNRSDRRHNTQQQPECSRRSWNDNQTTGSRLASKLVRARSRGKSLRFSATDMAGSVVTSTCILQYLYTNTRISIVLVRCTATSSTKVRTLRRTTLQLFVLLLLYTVLCYTQMTTTPMQCYDVRAVLYCTVVDTTYRTLARCGIFPSDTSAPHVSPCTPPNMLL